MTMGSASAFGPWAEGIDRAERAARFRSLRALALLLTGSRSALVAELRAAETDPAAAERALVTLEALPSLTMRRLLSSYAALHAPPKHRKVA